MKNNSRTLGVPVESKTLDEIRNQAHQVIDWSFLEINRDRSSLRVPIFEMIEFLGSLESLNRSGRRMYPDYEYVDDCELPKQFALYDVEKNLFKVRESVYDAAEAGCSEARFYLAHEFGHYALRHRYSQFGFSLPNGQMLQIQDSEWQADKFAEELLMDCRIIERIDTPKQLQDKFGVNEHRATQRLLDLMREGKFTKK